jgi:IS30 family transposase
MSATMEDAGNAATTKTPTDCCGKYLPRRSRLADRTQAELDQIATELNNRPRQTLARKTPSQVLDEAMR